MDIISHGLWGSAAFGRKTKRSFLIAFFFGVLPDLFSFGIFFVQRLFTDGLNFNHSGPPDIATIPQYVDTLYNFTHSIFAFSVVFIIVWLFLERPLYEMFAWLVHILLDIFTHSYAFFPTPFLWPISNFKVDGISWAQPIIFVPNIVLLVVVYILFLRRKKS